MKNAKIVIGANFGDEGKGLMTDYFCSRVPKDKPVLNVRFNGGAQAGHTVVTPEGKRHVFSHFGAGSFLPNVATYLGPEFIVNPILFRKEFEKLQAKGIFPLVYCHPKCILTMPQDMMVNQFIEKRRGNDRHGSCGVGIYETILRNSHCQTFVTADGLNNARQKYSYAIDFDYYSCERVEKMTGLSLNDDEKALLINQNIKAHYNDDIQFFMNHVGLIDDKIFDYYDYVVFEGAQGLMLDQNNIEYFPYLTPSNTGVENVIPFLDEAMDIEVCYVTRPYLTRHGNGYLPDECLREMVGAKVDLTNHENEWQGKLRYGQLNVWALYQRCAKDFDKLSKFKPALSFAFTHMDEHDGRHVQAIKDNIIGNCDRIYSSFGPDRTKVADCCVGISQKTEETEGTHEKHDH